MTQEERKQSIEGCRYVDEVIINAPLTVTDEYLKKHKIDLVIHGDDYSPENIQHYYGAARKRGIFKTVAYTQGVSTSDLINRIRSREQKELVKHGG